MLLFTFWGNGKGDGDEISAWYFVFNVRGSVSIYLYVSREYLNVGIVMATSNQR